MRVQATSHKPQATSHKPPPPLPRATGGTITHRASPSALARRTEPADTPEMFRFDITHNMPDNGYIKQHRLIKVQEDTMSNYTTAPTQCHHCGLSVFPSGSNSVTVLSDGEWIDTHFTCPA